MNIAIIIETPQCSSFTMWKSSMFVTNIFCVWMCMYVNVLYAAVYVYGHVCRRKSQLSFLCAVQFVQDFSLALYLQNSIICPVRSRNPSGLLDLGLKLAPRSHLPSSSSLSSFHFYLMWFPEIQHRSLC